MQVEWRRLAEICEWSTTFEKRKETDWNRNGHNIVPAVLIELCTVHGTYPTIPLTAHFRYFY